jgi:hypothetical protein
LSTGAVAVSLSGAACRTAVVVSPRDPNTQTVVTVEQRSVTQPGDKGLIIRQRETTSTTSSSSPR